MSVVSLSDDIEDRHNEHGLTRFGFPRTNSYPKNSAPLEDTIFWTGGVGCHVFDRDIFEKLQEACKLCSGLDRYYLPLAIYLATRTGMSLEEMCAVTWQDIDLEKRCIEIPMCQMDLRERAGRLVVLPFMTAWYLRRVALSLQSDNRFDRVDRLFPMASRQLENAWTFVAERAGIGQLSFDDLRREASVTFSEAGLSKLQHDLILGYSGDKVLPISYADVETIRDRLDWCVLNGLTYEEAKENIPLVPPEEILSSRKWLVIEGLLVTEVSAPDVIPHFPNIILSKL